MKRLLLMYGLMLCAVLAYSQRTITGVVTDDTGEGLIGASVLVEGSDVGTVTDFDGSYSINVPDEASSLLFTYTGYQEQRVPIGASNVIDVTMQEGVALQEVVVTALGIERKKDEDLSSSTMVSMEGFEKANEAGVLQGLSGKTSGVNITSTSGDPGAGAYIQIRGQNTILADNNPLIVLDGAIISNSSSGSSTAGVVQQSRLNDINPEDIESITVLKGASAAAIYGSNASNGVLVIKTKRGFTGDKRWKVDVKSSVRVDQVNVEWDTQDSYGQGYPDWLFSGSQADINSQVGGNFVANTGFSFGDKIADRAGGADVVDQGASTYFVADDGTTYYPVTTKNSRETFNQKNRDLVFDDGVVFENSVGLNYSDKNTRNYISFSRWDQDGMYTAGANYIRNTIRLNNSTKLADNFELKFSGQYTNISSDRVQTGSNLNGLYLGYLRNSPDFDMEDYKGTNFSGGFPTPNSHRNYRRHLGSDRTFDPASGTFSYRAGAYNNPLWTLYEQTNRNKVNRFILSPELSYQITDNFQVVGRYSIDRYTDKRQNYWPAGSAGDGVNGLYYEDNIQESFENYNLFVNGNFDLSSKINLNAIVGYQLLQKNYTRVSGLEANFTNPDERFLHFGNATANNSNINSNVFTGGQFIEESANAGLYGVFNFSLFDQLLVEISGRAERHSSIPDRGIVFYPAVSAGWVLTDYLPQGGFVSFAKLRASYAEVANAPIPYTTTTTFNTTTLRSSWGDGLDNATYGNPISRSTQRGNADLREERVREFEVGVDARFVNNRITFGATYYNRRTTDALILLPSAPSSGFTESYQNAAELENYGLELELSGDVIRNDKIDWNVYANVSFNRNEVLDLADIDYFLLNGFTSTSSGVAQGQPFGVIRGGAFARDAQGNLELNEAGFPVFGSDEFIGDPNPDWIGGLGTSISFSNFTLSALLQTSQGNDIWNGTKGVLYYFGVHPETAQESVSSTPLNNAYGLEIAANTPFRGTIQDFGGGPVAVDAAWWTGNGGGFGDVAEEFIEDGSWTRLREVTLSYNLPNSVLDKIGVSDVQVSFSGRNLALWTDVEGFDPESNLTGASKGRGLEYFSNPGNRSFIASLRFSF